jgi:hypothetical protein
VPGPPGEKGLDGINGTDGAPGRDGINGTDGADGLGFDGADLTFDERTGYALTLTAGGRTKSWPLPWFADFGVWKFGRAYPKGASVTKDGSQWIAQVETTDRPGESKAWRLAVRRGSDGKDAKPHAD